MVEKINFSLILGILAGGIVILAALAQWNEKNKEAAKAKQSEIKADSAQKELKSLQIENLRKTNQLADAYKQIVSLQNELKNEITGGASTPLLKLATSGKIEDKKSGKTYRIVFFDIINTGQYPLQNVKCTIYDTWGLRMLTYGVKHFRDGLSVGAGTPTQDEIHNYNPTKHFDIGAITKGKSYPLYMTTVCEEQPNSNLFGYTVEIQWNSGSVAYFIHLKEHDNSISIESMELSLNGKLINNYDKYFKLNK